MKQTHEFLVPDYYPAFSCKMGQCRNSCCEGWPISFTRQDYFNLLSIECSPELRKKLDCAMHLKDNPTPEEYAQISPRYDGNCPMRLEDGKCGLQAELGEDVLADVCRLYPRGVRTKNGYECSCANSCEAVPELLLTHPEPIRFRNYSMTIDVPDEPETHIPDELAERKQSIRLWLIHLMQNRGYSLRMRFGLLHEATIMLEQALKKQDWKRIDSLISGNVQISAPEAMDVDMKLIRGGMKQSRQILEHIIQHSDSIRSYGEEIFHYFDEGRGTLTNYTEAEEKFEQLLPQWEYWFENLLVNHMFFTQFPFTDPPMPIEGEFAALCGVYILLRFLCVGWTAQHDSIQDIIDVAAAAFRLIEHTDFDHYVAGLVHASKKLNEDSLCE